MSGELEQKDLEGRGGRFRRGRITSEGKKKGLFYL